MAEDFNAFRLPFYSTDVTIESGDDTSDLADLGNHTLCGLIVPATMTGTSLSFLASIDGDNFYELRQANGDAYTLDIDGTAAMYAIGPQDAAGARYIKIVSDATELADRTLKVLSIRTVTR